MPKLCQFEAVATKIDNGLKEHLCSRLLSIHFWEDNFFHSHTFL